MLVDCIFVGVWSRITDDVDGPSLVGSALWFVFIVHRSLHVSEVLHDLELAGGNIQERRSINPKHHTVTTLF